MSGPADAKVELEDARVYVHRKDAATRSNAIHIDVEHPELNEIIHPGENSFVGGKDGGVFIGLKDAMQDRAEAYVGDDE